MKKLFALAVLSICVAAPSFANDVVGHSVKVAGKDSAKAVAIAGKDSAKAVGTAGKDTGKATVKVVKFLF
jgi:opacity protein-like surface antigen